MVVTKMKKYSAMDRTGVLYEYKKNQSSYCERVIAIQWNDTNELQLRHCKGDGRLPNFVIFNEIKIPNGTVLDAKKFVMNVMFDVVGNQL